MRLVLVAGRFPERSETFIYRKAVGLASRGHDVTVLVREIGDWSLYPAPRPPTLHVEQVPADDSLRTPRRALSAARGLVRGFAHAASTMPQLWAMSEQRTASRGDAARMFVRHLGFANRVADVIHAEFLDVAMMYPLAAEVTGAPLVVSCRGSDVNMLALRKDRDRDLAVQMLRRADALHCVSEEIARAVAGFVGGRDRIWINRPAVDTASIVPRSGPRAGGPIRLLATGRLDWKKGFEQLLVALAQVASRGVAFHAQILGDGELRSALRYTIEDLGLRDHVELVGAVPSAEVLRRMQQADVFVLSSVAEGISNAVLEAMASGLPIVTTRAGGMHEAVTDGVEGLVVPVRDIEALAAAIARVATDEPLRQKLGEAARRRAVAEFSLTRQIDVFEQMYRSLQPRGTMEIA